MGYVENHLEEKARMASLNNTCWKNLQNHGELYEQGLFQRSKHLPVQSQQ